MMTQFTDAHMNGLVQDCSNSIANTLELLQSCAKPSPLTRPEKVTGSVRSAVNVYSMTIDTTKTYFKAIVGVNCNMNISTIFKNTFVLGKVPSYCYK